ncbi:MAG: hypothetical protein M3Q16_02250 [Pseudomonadota bacterium]|nr:hypothetical protein [Pseudomonadota bacterium]
MAGTKEEFSPGPAILAVLLPVPLEVTALLFPLFGPSVDLTQVLWVRVDVRVIALPINTPWLASNWLMVLVPRLAPLLFVAAPPSLSVTLAELLKLIGAVLITRALAGNGAQAQAHNARATFWFTVVGINFIFIFLL